MVCKLNVLPAGLVWAKAVSLECLSGEDGRETEEKDLKYVLLTLLSKWRKKKHGEACFLDLKDFEVLFIALGPKEQPFFEEEFHQNLSINVVN